MFGAYQAGVWREIERVLRPDLVVGASVGALNGWKIAGGASGGELAEAWLRHGAAGLLRRAATERWIRDIYESTKPQLPYGLVLTELPSLSPRLFRWPGIEWQHLAGSCAIPFVLSPQRIAARSYCDGGLMIPLPLWAAVEMGATNIIAVNLLAKRPLLIAVAAHAAQRYCGFRPAPAGGVQIIEILPSARLGSLRESITWTREQTTRLIELGRADARACLPQLERMAGNASR